VLVREELEPPTSTGAVIGVDLGINELATCSDGVVFHNPKAYSNIGIPYMDMGQKDFSKRIIVGITGNKDIHWKSKLSEINKRKITEAALFLERFKKAQRERIYSALLNSCVKKIPLVHVKNVMSKEEIENIIKNFNPTYLTIHEESFNVIEKWKGLYKRFFLEMNYDNFVSRKVSVDRVGGFCVDLSHFKVEEEKWSKEFLYIIRRRRKSLFSCNHLNGYSYKGNKDLHTIRSLKDFEYLKTLPRFVFGEVIALEVENSITDQLRFKKYLVKLLG